MSDLDRRWGVEVTHWSYGKRLQPFLAGRYYFDRYQGTDRSAEDDRPPTATFDTRAAARKRCSWVRSNNRGGWRTTARAVRVRVSVEREGAGRAD